MRAHYLQHVPFEGLGAIEPWLGAAGYEVTRTPMYESVELPTPEEIDFLVVMGGPMSVNHEAELGWLVPEKRLVRAAVESGKPVFGVCLGAQMIASAMGARVYRNREKEIGWFAVRAVEPATADGDGDPIFRFPPSTEVFHWHGDTFDLPRGAVHLARSEACDNQAFQLGRSTIGLQFHLETTPEGARELIRCCRGGLEPSTYVQTEEEILAAGPERYRSMYRLMGDVLRFLHEAGR